MPQRHRVLTALLVTPLIALVVTAVLHRPADARDRHRADPPCPTDCGVRLDRGPWVYAGDRPVTAICVKAGRERFSLNQNGTTGCFTVSGLGTANVTVTTESERDEQGQHEREEHRHCRRISSVVFYFDCGGLLPG